MKTQAEKAADFAALHAAPGAFVAPNPWDPGSARILAGLGFKALTTTSSGYARSIGLTDHKAGRDSVLAHIAPWPRSWTCRSALISRTDSAVTLRRSLKPFVWAQHPGWSEAQSRTQRYS